MNNNNTKDILFGFKCENVFLQKFKKFKKLDKFNEFDFFNKEKRTLIELKSRNYCFNGRLKDWQVGINKIDEARKLKRRGYKIFFYMMFYDGLYYWKFKENKLQDDTYIKIGGRTDRDKNEEKDYVYIKSDVMKKSKINISVPLRVDPFEECLI